MWSLCVVATVLFGCVITLWFRGKPQQFFLTLCAGWLVGYMLNGMALYASSYFFFVNFSHVVTFFVLESVFTIVIGVYLRKRYGSEILKIDFEETPGFYAVLIVCGLVGIHFLSCVYDKLPYSGPSSMFNVFDSEMSFVRSMLIGVNMRRDSFFHFRDPLRVNASYERPVVPLMLVAACEALGSDYKYVSVVICFFNILATCGLLYQMAAQVTTHRISSVLCFMMFSGNAILFYFFAPETVDLVHRIGKFRMFPLYQVMSCLLMQLKSFSVSVPLAMLSLGQLQASASGRRKLIFAGFVASLIPENLVFFSVLAVASCFPHCVRAFVPFIVSCALRFSNLHLIATPLWREWQMDGIFFAQVAIWLGSFGPLLIGLKHSNKHHHIHHVFLAKLATFIILCFIRDGNDYKLNGLAIEAVWLPQLCISFVKNLNKLSSGRRSSKAKGVLIFASWFLIILQIAGGLLSMWRTTVQNTTYIEPEIFTCAGKIVARIHPDSSILCTSNTCRLAMYYGKQILVGDWRYLWTFGLSIDNQTTILKNLEVSKDPVSIMTMFNFEYFIDERDNPIIPQNYSRQSCLKQETHILCPISVYKLTC